MRTIDVADMKFGQIGRIVEHAFPDYINLYVVRLSDGLHALNKAGCYWTVTAFQQNENPFRVELTKSLSVRTINPCA
jgi:hypothetical protein